MIPNEEQKKFILEELIPFIQREHGCGFAMSTWHDRWVPGQKVYHDTITRVVPVCGSVCCIGGSIQMLLAKKKVETEQLEFLDAFGAIKEADLFTAIGLSQREADALFYSWRPYNQLDYGLGWPEAYADRFFKASTTEAKAEVACELLREIAEKGDELLHKPEEEV